MTRTRGPRWLWLDQRVDAKTRDKTLGLSASHVAYVLAVRYMNGSIEAWPSQKELAAATGLSQRTVWAALNELERHDLIEIRHGRPAQTDGCVYRLKP